MNFVIWLLKRVRITLFGTKRYGWVAKYRDLIMDEKPISIILTVLMGALWFIASGLLCVWLIEDRATIGVIMKCVLLSVPAFYIYNWLAALYVIYQADRMSVWEELKR